MIVAVSDTLFSVSVHVIVRVNVAKPGGGYVYLWGRICVKAGDASTVTISQLSMWGGRPHPLVIGPSH